VERLKLRATAVQERASPPQAKCSTSQLVSNQSTQVRRYFRRNKTDTVDTVGLNTFVITSKLCPNYDIITFYLNIFI